MSSPKQWGEAMLQNLQAEIVFPTLDTLHSGVAALTERGFKIELMDWVDEHGPVVSPAVWIKARIAAEFADDDHSLGWVMSIVEPLYGEVVEAGFAD
jgi:hypothetical protein